MQQKLVKVRLPIIGLKKFVFCFATCLFFSVLTFASAYFVL